MVELSTATLGDFNGQITLSPLSENAQPFCGVLTDVVINLSGSIKLLGDFNDDSIVDKLDIDLMRMAVIAMTSDALFNVDGLDDPNIPNEADFVELANRFGMTFPSVVPSSNVPEPATLVILSVPMLLRISRRLTRRRTG